jgi:uncharacterized membrane protein
MNDYVGNASAERLAVGLGWFSIALGIVEVAAPDRVARFIGARDDDTTRAVLRGFGSREIANGIAILTQPDQARWLWSRVAGDAVDLASLGTVLQEDRADRGRTLGATAAVLGVTALDILCATRLDTERLSAPRSRAHRRVVESITVNRPLDEVTDAWRGQHGDESAESVRFAPAPGARGTEVHVELDSGGRLDRVTRIVGHDAASQLRERLRHFKQRLEAGEVPVSDGPSMWRPAQPAGNARARTLAGVRS